MHVKADILVSQDISFEVPPGSFYSHRLNNPVWGYSLMCSIHITVKPVLSGHS